MTALFAQENEAILATCRRFVTRIALSWPDARVCGALLALGIAHPADAQEDPYARERVYIVADSGHWVLAYHTFPEYRTGACEVATREQPGAILRWWRDRRSFTLYLMPSQAVLESFVLQVDDKRPVMRTPTEEERRTNTLHIRGTQLGGHIDRLVNASRLRIQALYPDREKQDLELDLTGFTPLYWRAMQNDCVPPTVKEEYCAYLRKRYRQPSDSAWFARQCPKAKG